MALPLCWSTRKKKIKSAGEPAISILILWTLNKIQFTVDIDLVH